MSANPLDTPNTSPPDIWILASRDGGVAIDSEVFLSYAAGLRELRSDAEERACEGDELYPDPVAVDAHLARLLAEEVRIVRYVPEDRLAEMQARIERLSEALRYMTGEVRAEVQRNYDTERMRPEQRRRYTRDMAPVLEAEALLREGGTDG